MKIKIKICGMRDHVNINHVVKLNPDLIGFIFYPDSPRYVSELMDPETLLMIPPDIRKVGVFVNEDISEMKKKISKYFLNMVQLHGDESPETCMDLKDAGIPVMKALHIKSRYDFKLCRKYLPCTDYFLFDHRSSEYGGSGHQFDWEILEYYDLEHPFFLSGGIGPGDVQRLINIKIPAFYGIDINSRFEISPGYKNIEILQPFINEFRKEIKKDE